MCGIVDYVFDDKRICTLLLGSWMCIVLVIFYEIGILQTNWMSVGPSDRTVFMGMQINTWYRYSLVSLFTLVSTCVNDFMSDAISPWIINTITDHKNKYIPYSKLTCIAISQFWSVYCNIMGIFNIFLSMTQIDFVLLRTVADVLMSCYTNMKFLRHKTFNHVKYKEYERGHENELQTFVISDEAEESGKT